MSNEAWTLVLAGGSGRRLAAHTGGIPKQFYSISDGPTLLDETVSRVTPVAGPERTVIVVDRSHRKHVDSIQGPAKGARYVYQPVNRGTAAGVLLGMSSIVEHDPDAIVVMTPADHGVREAAIFIAGVRHALAALRRDEVRMVLFGIEPAGLHGDYGWIVPAEPRSAGRLQTVIAFVEKPAPERAVRLFAEGAVWNTMVLVARAASVLDVIGRQQPELTELFRAHSTMPRMMRERFLANRYPCIPSVDFSHDVITPAARSMTLFTWPAAMGWSDLGTPERLSGWLGIRQARELAS